MDGKIIWSSNMTKDHVKGLNDDEKQSELEKRGYDLEMVGDDIDGALDSDAYMSGEDENDFMETVAPMINSQTNGLVIAVDKNNNDIRVCSAEDLVNDLVGNGDYASINVVDVNGNVEVQYLDAKGKVVNAVELYAVPETNQEEFVKQVLPEWGEEFDAGTEEYGPVDDTENNITYILDDPDDLENWIDVEALKQFGPRIRNKLNESKESLTEANVSKVPRDFYYALRNFNKENTSNEYANSLGYGDNAFGYGNINNADRSKTDRERYNPAFDPSKIEVKEITPEEALQKFKSGDSRNIWCTFKDNNGKPQLANRFRVTDANGKSKDGYDFKVNGTFTKTNGKEVPQTTWLTPTELYTTADHVFEVGNMPEYDLGLRDARTADHGAYSILKNKPVKSPVGNAKLLKSNTQYNNNRQFTVPATTSGGSPSQVTAYKEDDKVYFDGWLRTPVGLKSAWNWISYDELQNIINEITNKDDLDPAVKDEWLKMFNEVSDWVNPTTDEKDPTKYDWTSFNADRDARANKRYAYYESNFDKLKEESSDIVNRIKSARESLHNAAVKLSSLRDPATVEWAINNADAQIERILKNIEPYLAEIAYWQQRRDDIETENEKEIEDAEIAKKRCEKGIDDAKAEFGNFLKQKFFNLLDK